MPTFRTVVRTAFPIGSGGGTNTWHLRTSGAPGSTASNISTLMETVRQFYLDCAVVVPSTTAFQWDGRASEVGTEEPGYFPFVTGWTTNGSNTASDYTSAATMACVSWRTTLSTPAGRGRTFLGPLATDMVQSNGTLENDITSLLRSAAASLVSDSTAAADGALGVWSESQGIFRDFIGATVNDRVAVLRSRRG